LGNLSLILAWAFLEAQCCIVVVGLIITDCGARVTVLRCNIAKFIHRMANHSVAILTASIGRCYQRKAWYQRYSANGKRQGAHFSGRHLRYFMSEVFLILNFFDISAMVKRSLHKQRFLFVLLFLNVSKVWFIH